MILRPSTACPMKREPVVKELKALAREAEHVYLATDPDREGEAIAWHLLEAAEIDPAASERVVFHEITEPAIAEAFSHPRQINMDLVDAQQARRILDRLVGYSISPLLWQKVRSRLSAGRVQSVALRLIVEREREIESFVPVEYWSIQAELTPDSKNHAYLAKLVKIGEADPDLKIREMHSNTWLTWKRQTMRLVRSGAANAVANRQLLLSHPHCSRRHRANSGSQPAGQ